MQYRKSAVGDLNNLPKYQIISGLLFLYTEWRRKKVDHHGVCEHNLRKLLLNNGFILVERRWQPEIGSGKEQHFEY